MVNAPREIGIPLLDSVLEILPWNKVSEYGKIIDLYGEEKAEILRDLILFPLLGFNSISDLSESTPYGKDQLYMIYNDKRIDWIHFLEEFTMQLFMSMLKLFKHGKPWYQSRYRIRLINDDTLLERWSLKMTNTMNLYDHSKKRYTYAQNVMTLMVTFGDDKFGFPLMVRLMTPKDSENHLTKGETFIHLLDLLDENVKEHNLSLQGLRLSVDSAYTTKKIVEKARSLGIDLFGSLGCGNVLYLKDGTYLQVKDLHQGNIPLHFRQDRRTGQAYARLVVNSPSLGKISIAVFPYTDVATGDTKFWTSICSNPDVDSVTIIREIKCRWRVEEQYRDLKQNLGVSSYHGKSLHSTNAHLALSALRYLISKIALRLARRFSSLASGLKQFTVGAIVRLVRKYTIHPKCLSIKRLHYVLIS